MLKSDSKQNKYVIEELKNPPSPEEVGEMIEYVQDNEEGFEFLEIGGNSFLIKQDVDKITRDISNDVLYRCSNRQCKKKNVCFASSVDLDFHNSEIHVEQWKSSECPICNKKLQNTAKLNVHMELRHTPKLFTCDNCGKTFRSKDNLRLHMTHHRKYYYVECRACKKGYKSIQSLRYHLRQHFEHHQCDTCGIVYEHKKLLLGHVAAKHKHELQVQCRFCTRLFSRADVRDAHEKEIHKNGEIGSYFKCTECDQAFDFRDELMSHKILNHFSGVIHSCEECGKNFKKKSLLDLHMHVHREKSYSCDVCNMFFTFLTGLNKHKKMGRCKGPQKETLKDKLGKDEIARIAREQLMEITVNPKKSDLDEMEMLQILEPKIKKAQEKPTVVVRNLTSQEIIQQKEESVVVKSSSGRIIKKKMPVSFSVTRVVSKKSNQSVSDEKVTNLKKRDKKFECDQCGKRYHTNHLLLMHKKSHANLKEYKCGEEDCSFETNSPYDLNTHFKRIHNPKRPFECKVCGKNFKRRCDMHNHRDTVHSEVKTYVKCPFETCDTIVLEKGLQSHLINRHSEKGMARPFVCQICGKSERYEKNLQRHHDAVHEPKDRGIIYQCPDCPEQFYRRRDITNHSFEHFEGTIHICSTCGNKYKTKKELTNHTYSHRGQVFPCPVCKQVFQTKSGRRKHMNKHDGMGSTTDGLLFPRNMKRDETVIAILPASDDEVLEYESYEMLDEAEYE